MESLFTVLERSAPAARKAARRCAGVINDRALVVLDAATVLEGTSVEAQLRAHAMAMFAEARESGSEVYRRRLCNAVVTAFPKRSVTRLESAVRVYTDIHPCFGPGDGA